MRTIRCSSRLLGGAGCLPRGVCPGGCLTDRPVDRRMWKHYLGATTLRTVKTDFIHGLKDENILTHFLLASEQFGLQLQEYLQECSVRIAVLYHGPSICYVFSVRGQTWEPTAALLHSGPYYNHFQVRRQSESTKDIISHLSGKCQYKCTAKSQDVLTFMPHNTC